MADPSDSPLTALGDPPDIKTVHQELGVEPTDEEEFEALRDDMASVDGEG